MGEGEWIAAPLTQRQLQHKVRAGRGVTLQLQRVLSRQCALREVGKYSLRRTHFRVGSTIGGAPPMLGECGLRSEDGRVRSEEHTSELQSLMRISYAVFCLKKKKTKTQNTMHTCKSEE